ncbi:CDP-alcohol phosphatidyltransferase family protein [Heyndrickxia coagulans]|uniref:CDP-alcohol phosphatidyltransferase family protein n=1 Tax=Heyndrickxia coagulans TaxID=1398 RepID=UPI001F3CC3CE|nr:CDP-alcohol phosphatidyltransferase family protein [Heyndrickxia coagulans]UJZ87813.1 CDP-alcohol phosphatidyltransferase family protein [Heyndrickxia coagulans]
MDIWVYYVIRPLSFFVTWLFLKVKINANLATIISMIIGVIGSFIFIPNGFFFHLIGAILINLWIVLDCVDGNIARFTKKTSTFGMFLDGLSGYFFTTFLYICIGLSVFFSQNYYEPFGEQKWVYLLLGSLTSMRLSFNEGAKKWAEVVVSMKNNPRKNTIKELTDAGYNIKTAAKGLQEYYFKCIKNLENQ